MTFLPGPVGNELRVRFYRDQLRFLGDGVTIDVGVRFDHPEHISIGHNCWIDRYVIVMAGPPREGLRKLSRKPNALFHHAEGEVVVGDNCHIASHAVVNGHGGVEIGRNSTVAAGARIVSLSHHHRNADDPDDDFPYRFGSMAPEAEQALISGPVVMQENSGLATNAVMVPASAIGHDSWVGACSLVVDTIPPNCIAWGTPARPMRERLHRGDDSAVVSPETPVKPDSERF